MGIKTITLACAALLAALAVWARLSPTAPAERRLDAEKVGEQPAFYFTHFWGKGRAEDLARGLEAALDAQKAAGPGGH